MIWTVAGFDSSGGAGVIADYAMFRAAGKPAATLLTAMTAQNSRGVASLEWVGADMVGDQFNAILMMGKPTAVKVGLVSQAALDRLRDLPQEVPIICDPVLYSTSGTHFNRTETYRAFFSRCDLLTPNLEEAAKWFGDGLTTEQYAERFLDLGVKSVLIKGGHRLSDFCSDYWADGESFFWVSSPRRSGENFRGTGCALSSAIAALWEKGPREAIVLAKTLLNGALRNAKTLDGASHLSPVSLSETCPDDFPRVAGTIEESERRLNFPATKLDSLYVIVDSAEWVERVAEAGVKTVQLRNKTLRGEELKKELARGVEISKKWKLQLYINDYWEEAMELGAFGVHLGQEDLERADLEKISEAGLHLGISTHSYEELARAYAIEPSYYALGPIFETTCKSMKFGPQGYDKISEWKTWLNRPLVAIGGMNSERSVHALKSGADSVAVLSNITQSSDPFERISEFR